MKQIPIILFCCAITFSAAFSYAYEIRTWRSNSGETAEAQLINVSKYHIVLQNTDDKQIKIHKEQLSEQDLQYMDKLYALKELEYVLKENAFELSGKIKKMDGRDITLSDPMRIKTTIVKDPDDKIKRMRPVLVKKKEMLPVTKRSGTAIVLNARRNIDITGAEWSGTVYPCGTKRIKKKKIKYFSVSLRLAKQHILTMIDDEEYNADAIRELIAPLRIEKKEPIVPEKLRMK